MLTWVMYDIVIDRTRDKAAKACLQAGSVPRPEERVPGHAGRERARRAGHPPGGPDRRGLDSVYIFPMCRPDFSKVNLLGQAFDEKMVCDEVRSLLI